MPELPEVEITRQKLAPLVIGHSIRDFSTDWPRGLRLISPRALKKDIIGRTILALSRHGKVLRFHLSGQPERSFVIHLRMSGRLVVLPSTSPRNKWTRFSWAFENGQELRFTDPRKFGIVWYGSEVDFKNEAYLSALGPDAANISYENFRAAFASRRGMAKAALLAQNHLAGIGNIVADEALWRARIHPRVRVETLANKDWQRLHNALQKTIQISLSLGGSTLRDWGHPDGQQGKYQTQRMVYAKASLPCPRCHDKLERLIVAGRGTTICPKCQVLPQK